MIVRSILVWVVTWLYMTAAGVVCLPWTVLTGRMRTSYAAARLGVRLLLWLGGVRVVVEGRELLPRDPRCIFMANHQSNLDPPILLAHLPGEVAFLAKKELFSVPVLGTVLRAGRLVPVDRSRRAAAQASITQAAEAVKAGRPFLIFPEGTRSRHGELLPFKKGAFFFAEQANSPVVPITLSGTGALLPRGEWRIRPGVVYLRIHPAVEPKDWQSSPEPRAAIAAAVRARISQPMDAQPG